MPCAAAARPQLQHGTVRGHAVHPAQTGIQCFKLLLSFESLQTWVISSARLWIFLAVFAMQGSNLARTINTMLRDAESLPELADIVEEWRSNFDPIHTATAFYMTGSLVQGNRAAIASARPLLDELSGIWGALLPGAGAQALSNVLWTCSKLRYTDPTLWSSTVAKFIQLLEESDDVPAQTVSNLMYSLATIASVNRSVVPGMSKEEVEEAATVLCCRMQVLATNPTADAVNSQDLSNILWGCTKLAFNPGSALLNSLLQAMAREKVIEAATGQAVSNSLWAVSELQLDCGWQPQLPQRAWERLLGELPLARIANTDKPQGVANALVALGRLAAATKPAEGTTPVVSRESAQQCALQLLQGKVARQLEMWGPQDITNSMLALSQLGVSADSFFDRAAAALPVNAWLSRATAASLMQVASACEGLQLRQQQQLMSGAVQWSRQLLQQQQQQMSVALRVSMGAVVSKSVAVLDMPQLAGDVTDLVAVSKVATDEHASSGNLAMLWEVHAWLVQHQLLDGQGIAGLLTEQQLAKGKAAAAVKRQI
jgi:hypothetical protein